MEYCSLDNAMTLVNVKIDKALNDLHLVEKGFKTPSIVWRDIGIRRAGTCNYNTNTITLNTNYLQSKDWENFINTTPLHELAHAIAFQFYFETGHKNKWKQICYLLGLLGNRCHNYSVPEVEFKRKRKRYKAHCPCGMEHIITSVKYNRIKKGIGYMCVKCHGKIELDETI